MKEDKIEQMLRAMEHPEEFTDEELETLFQDQEVRDCYEAALKAEQAFAARRQQPEQQTKVVAMSPRLWFRVAAAFIGLVMLSSIVYAIIIGTSAKTSPKEQVMNQPTKPLTEQVVSLPADTTLTFENTELDSIVNRIADHYNVGVDFRNETASHLRLYTKWSPSEPLEQVVERLNAFEKVDIKIENHTLTIE
jgi:hypothetical protein